ncbi:MAG TPA: GTP 3',8-cyclase MoaA [Candidatus Dojkabacteria bacterium]|nr:GTP 3',8-cyclase MoaA [Candidatus Dojkabacteria bacterium]
MNYYLRLGITGGCNLRCRFCNPNGHMNSNNDLSTNDWKEIIKAGSTCGIKEIHYTGGEPTIRRDLAEIIQYANELGYTDQSITTNGIIFEEKAEELFKAGLNRANISLSTLSSKQYSYYSNSPEDNYPKVINSIKIATKLFNLVKINCVVMKENFDSIESIVEFAQEHNAVLRLLELQNFAETPGLEAIDFNKSHVSKQEIVNKLKKISELTPTKVNGKNAVVEYYNLSGFKNPIGIIAPHSAGYQCRKDKCETIRISAQGVISYCAMNIDKNNVLANKNYDEKLEMMKKIIELKNLLHEKKDYPSHHIPPYSIMRFNK